MQQAFPIHQIRGAKQASQVLTNLKGLSSPWIVRDLRMVPF